MVFHRPRTPGVMSIHSSAYQPAGVLLHGPSNRRARTRLSLISSSSSFAMVVLGDDAFSGVPAGRFPFRGLFGSSTGFATSPASSEIFMRAASRPSKQ